MYIRTFTYIHICISIYMYTYMYRYRHLARRIFCGDDTALQSLSLDCNWDQDLRHVLKDGIKEGEVLLAENELFLH